MRPRMQLHRLVRCANTIGLTQLQYIHIIYYGVSLRPGRIDRGFINVIYAVNVRTAFHGCCRMGKRMESSLKPDIPFFNNYRWLIEEHESFFF